MRLMAFTQVQGREYFPEGATRTVLAFVDGWFTEAGIV